MYTIDRNHDFHFGFQIAETVLENRVQLGDLPHVPDDRKSAVWAPA